MYFRQNFKPAFYTSGIMTTRALLGASTAVATMSSSTIERGEGAAPAPAQPRILRSTVAVIVALVGVAVSLIFAVVARGENEGTGATGLFVAAIIFGVAAVVAWFQRSLEKQIIRLSEENDRFGRENDELKDTRRRLDQENKEFDEANRINALENERLAKNNAELEAEVARLAKEAKNLNALYNQSVNMVRQLAMFGDECKTLGHDLRDVAGDLKDTDDSLGLTAEELSRQTAAIQAATAALTKVAAAKARESQA